MKKKMCYWLVTAVLWAMGLNLLFIGAGFIEADREYQEAAASLYSVGTMLGLVRYGIVAPVLEELVFRGIFFKTIRRFWGPEGAVVISALLFGIYHGNAVQLVYAFCLGLVLAVSYEDADNFFIPVLLHSVVNIMVFLASSFYLFPGGSVALVSGIVFTTAGTAIFLKKCKKIFFK